MKRTFQLAFTLSVGFLISCSKPNNNSSTLPNVKEMVTQDGDTIGYNFFSYNSKNELISIYDSNNNDHIAYFVAIKYNASGLPVSVGEDSLIYNNNNQVIKKVSKADPGDFTPYTYDAMGRLVSDRYTTFTYDDSDDVILETDNPLYVIHISYTKTLNLNNSITSGNLADVIAPLGDFYGYQYLSKYKPSQAVDSYQVTNYAYEYNPDGTDSKIILTSPDSNIPLTFTFYY